MLAKRRHVNGSISPMFFVRSDHRYGSGDTMGKIRLGVVGGPKPGPCAAVQARLRHFTRLS